MTRNLKAGGLALIAVLAMSAFAASMASAKYDSEIKTTYVHAVSTTNEVTTTTAGTVTCKKATFTGVLNGTQVSSVPPIYTSKVVTSSPSVSECTAFGFPAEVKMNGCQYEFLEPTSLKAGTKILCPEGKQIEIVAIGFCTMTIGTQTPGGSVSYANEGIGASRDVKITRSETGMTYGGNCGSGTNATYSGTTTMKGYSDSGLTNQVGIWATS